MSRESTVVSMKKSFRDLLVWQKSVALAKSVYLLTEAFPSKEMYGLTSQMRRSAVSIASNIAEGSSRHSDKEFAHFLIVSRGSLAELITQLIISHEVGLLTESQLATIEEDCNEISRMIAGLRSRLTTND